jgi:type I restriction enzyme S subunit
MEATRKPVGELLDAVPRQPKIKRSAYQDSGRYPIVDQSQADIAGYTDDESWLYQGELPVVIFGDHTRVLKLVNFPFCVGADGTQLLRPVAGNDIRYFYYALRNVDLTNYGYERHFKYLKEEEIPVPPLPVQRRIAGILSAYDELMENSQRRIRLLEAMARALYREWFVHFRFPGHEKHPRVASPLGDIPQGWEVKTVEEIVKRIPVGKKYDQKTVNPTGAVPVFDQGKTGIIGYHDDEPGVAASDTAPVIVFANHTCYQRLVHISFSAIQNVLPFVPSPALPRNIYWLHWATNGLVVFNDYKGHWPEFAAKTLVVPPAELCQRFGEFAAPLSQQILKLERQIQNLRRTRDLLLPRLLSGQIENLACQTE